MEDVDTGVAAIEVWVFTILTHRTNTSSARAHPGLGVTTVSELRIQCIVVGTQGKVHSI